MRTACAFLVAAVCGMVTTTSVSGAEEAGWLGCRIGPVPRSLDAHLALDSVGVMVLNVAKDSPADKAGLERYDLIVRLDSDQIDSPDGLTKRVGAHRAGDKIAMVVIRKGQKKEVQVALAGRPEAPAAVEYKYDRLPDALLDDRVGIRGRIFRRGPDGWTFEDLGELDDIPPLFDRVLPRRGRKQGRFWFEKEEGPVQRFQARVVHEGQVIEVQGNVEGPITVRRTQRKGDAEKVRERTYETPAELKKSDPEAYKVYCEATVDQREGLKATPPKRPLMPRQGVGRRPFVDRYRRWLKDLHYRLPGVEDLPDRERLHDLLDQEYKEWSQELEKKLDALRERHGDLEKQLEERLERLRRRLTSPDQPAPATQESPAPTTRFEVDADGKITVHLRRDDSELTLQFKDADELKAKRPKLFEKFESLGARS